MTDRILIWITHGKNIFEILQIFKIVSRPIFCVDSKSVIHFCVRLKLGPRFEKRSENDLKNDIGLRTLQYEVLIFRYSIMASYRVSGT